MKRQQAIIAIFALIIFAFGASNANAQFGDFINKAKQKIEKVQQEAEKTKQEIENCIFCQREWQLEIRWLMRRCQKFYQRVGLFSR